MGETVKIWKSIQTRRDGFHWETLVPIPNIEIKALGLYENILTYNLSRQKLVAPLFIPTLGRYCTASAT